MKDFLPADIEAKLRIQAHERTSHMNEAMSIYKQQGQDGKQRPPTSKEGRRSFLRQRAYEAIVREGVSPTTYRQNFNEKWQEVFLAIAPALQGEVFCEYCQTSLTFDCNSHTDPALTAQRGREYHPFNFSIDRRHPGARGGLYEKNNIAMACAACNLLKGAKSAETYVGKLLSKLRKSHFRMTVDGFLTPAQPRTPVPMDANDEKIVRAHAKELWERCRKNMESKSRKEGDISVDDIIEMARECWAGGGRYQDPSGVILSFREAGIDRIDPNVGYTRKNCRLLVSGLNLARGDARDDRGIAGWLRTIARS